MQLVTIKRVLPSELLTLQAISRRTFSETFAADNTADNLNKYLEEELKLEKLSSEINNKDSAFYFAMVGEKIAGYLKINTGAAQTEPQEDKALEIERIYVLQEFQGEKIGQLLFETAVSIAGKMQAGYIWLGVWEKNIRAISFYEKNGFITFDKHLFRVGDDEQTDIMMKLNLRTISE